MTIFANDIQTLCKMAGYFDGEGCVLVSLSRRQGVVYAGGWRLTISSGDYNNLLLFSDRIYELKRRENSNVKCYQMDINGSKFLDLAIELEPYLIAKQPQMTYAIDSYCLYKEARFKKDKEQAIQIAVEAHAHLQQLKRHNYYAN